MSPVASASAIEQGHGSGHCLKRGGDFQVQQADSHDEIDEDEMLVRAYSDIGLRRAWSVPE